VDIHVPTGKDWLYLAAIKDLGTRELVGWSTGDQLRAELTADVLLMTIRRRQPPRGLIHHSNPRRAVRLPGLSGDPGPARRPPASPSPGELRGRRLDPSRLDLVRQ
jgi:transposase InsO family protein